jgi:DNA-binding NarL/FixJ family response regulator
VRSRASRATLGCVDEPIRLFLASPALAIRRALARALDAEADIEVVGEARSASQALARVPAARPHVVVAGAHLREPDAPEMCRRLLAGMPELNVLLIGVNATQDLVASAIRAGAVGVVPHTIDIEALVEAIRTAAAGRMVMSTDELTDVLRAERAATTSDPLANLTPLERELFALIGEGLTNAEIAERMRLAPGTVRNYVSRLLRKLQVERRAQVVAMAARRDVERESQSVDRAIP